MFWERGEGKRERRGTGRSQFNYVVVVLFYLCIVVVLLL